MAALLKTLRALASEEDSTRIGELLEAVSTLLTRCRLRTPRGKRPLACLEPCLPLR